MPVGNLICNNQVGCVARRGASLADERRQSVARADGARRRQTARAWPRAAQLLLTVFIDSLTFTNNYAYMSGYDF